MAHTIDPQSLRFCCAPFFIPISIHSVKAQDEQQNAPGRSEVRGRKSEVRRQKTSVNTNSLASTTF